MNFDMTLWEWLVHHHSIVASGKVSWMGVPFNKNVLDAWIYQELIFRVKPHVIVEIGNQNGGSTLFFAHLLDCIGKGKVIAVDIDRSQYHVKHERIIEVTGDSTSAEVIGDVHRLCRGKTVLINHDANHTKEYVLKDLENYSGLVNVGSYFIVEDGLADIGDAAMRCGITEGPLVAVNEFLRTNTDFVIDAECERYVLTANISGYLKRIK